ncbi:putative T7SS-secreted protein [Nocardia caishijiensis]|uniref:RHS repeat-associated protein n=1 Tax=Nocardia caishijiensis TaxID=184756 RepID=A0ABQ6YKA2_9NOCA|nr:RHS repeat-associated core domain-containing protein [Nocardia caishijiensis]KAF0846222.1 RHS repeat-associated protein [Nocardia caishijiensis]
MGVFDSLGDLFGRGVESAVEKAGELADDVLDVASVGATKLGMDSLAESLDDLGDQLASAAGGEVEERALGETKDPKELIRGEPTVITDAATSLRDMATQIAKTGDALKTIDAADWTGAGADAFNAVYDQQPKLWWDAAEAFTATAAVLDTWSTAVTTAQARAADAITEWERALTEERTKKDWWNSLTGDQQKQVGPLPDTWTALRDNARQILSFARTQRDNAAGEATTKIAEATNKAPTTPPFTSRMSANLSDLADIGEHAKLSFESGVLTGLTGLVQFVRQVNPADVYNITHPADYMSKMSDLGTGLVVAAADPGAAVDAILSEARANPFEFAGAITSDLLVTVATGGGGAAKPVLSAIDKLGDVGRRLPGGNHDSPDGATPERSGTPEPANRGDENAPPQAGVPDGPRADPQSNVDAGARPDSAPAAPAQRPDTHRQESPEDNTPGTPVHNTPEPRVEAPATRPDAETIAPRPDSDNPAPVRTDPADQPSTPAHADAPEPDPDDAKTVEAPRQPGTDPNPTRPVQDSSSPVSHPATDAPTTHTPADTARTEPPARAVDTDPATPKSDPGAVDSDSTRQPPARSDADGAADSTSDPHRSDAEHDSTRQPPARTDSDAETTADHDPTTPTRSDSEPPQRDSTTPASTLAPTPSTRTPEAPATTRAPDPRPAATPDNRPVRDTDTERTQPKPDEHSGTPDQDKADPSPTPRATPDSNTPEWQGDSRPSPDHDTTSAPARGDSDGSSAPDPNEPRTDAEGDHDTSGTDKSGQDESDTSEHVDDPEKIRESTAENPVEHDRTDEDIEECNDPVDAATGEFLLPELDLSLPGVLPLILKRRHRSNYRFGRWFGPSWSATLDMRVIVDDHGVIFIGEDGVTLLYPHAEPDAPVLPLAGASRWTLTRTEVGGYRVWDPERELIWHFAPEPLRAGLDVALGNYAISAITDRHRNRIRFHYDSDGAPIEITHSGGYRVAVTTARGRVTGLDVLGPSGGHLATIREFGYSAGQLVAITNGVGATTHYTYDHADRMTSWTDSNDNYMVNTYDAAGRVTRQRGIAGVLDAEFDYAAFPDGTGRITTHTNSLGAATTYGFDTDLRTRDVRDPNGARTHTDYNTDRNPLTFTAADGAVTRYTYTDDGDVASITRPDGNTIHFEYLFRNRPTRITDVDGTEIRREYDTNGNLTAIVATTGARTTFTHHPCGAVASITEPNGATTTIDVDSAGLPIRITDALESVTTIERDGLGRPHRITDALGATTIHRFSPTGQLLERALPDGHRETWTYDGEDNLLTHTDPAGGVTRFTYTAFDLLAARTDPAGATTTYTWDTERRLTSVTNPNGEIWHYVYDPAGHLIAQTDYTGATTRYAHDPAGRTATVTPATGITRHHAYDILGRLTAITTDSRDWIHYTHDVSGRLLAAANGTGETPSHTIQFTYTESGQLASQQVDDQPPMRFDHDDFGRRTRRTTPSGAQTHWSFDYAGRHGAMTADGHNIDFTYDLTGRLTRWQLDELAVDTTYNPTGLPTTQTVTAHPHRLFNIGLDSAPRTPPSTLRTDEYAWRPDGYLTNHTTHHPDSASISRDYELDPIGRVTTLTRNNQVTERYTYDPLSNITSSHTPDSKTTPAPDTADSGRREYRNNLLIRNGRTTYHYDSAGRLIRKTTTRLSRKPATWHYRYNSFDQLTDVWTPDHQWWHYTYDPLGRRTSKQHRTTDGTILDRTDYTWDATTLTEQTTLESTTRWHYQPGTHTPLTQTTDQPTIDREFYAIITDLVGTPAQLIDPKSAYSMAAADVGLWGRTIWRGQSSSPLRFPGQIYDPETGLHYNMFRYYNADTGRYLTPDPLGLDPSPNPHSYTTNPLRFIDPLGLRPTDCERFKNFHRQVAPGDLHGAPPPYPGGYPGHALSKHRVSAQVQASILNNPERIFSGNFHGVNHLTGQPYTRSVDIYYNNGSVVITEAGNKSSVITAYGLIDKRSSSPRAVNPDKKWADDPNFVEIRLNNNHNEVIYPNRENWERNEWQ